MGEAISLEDGCAECPLFDGRWCVELRREPDALVVLDDCPVAYGRTAHHFVHEGRRACGRSRHHALLGRLVCFSPPGERGCQCQQRSGAEGGE